MEIAQKTTFTSIHHQYALRLARPRTWKVLLKSLPIASSSEHPGIGAVSVVGGFKIMMSNSAPSIRTVTAVRARENFCAINSLYPADLNLSHASSSRYGSVARAPSRLCVRGTRGAFVVHGVSQIHVRMHGSDSAP